MGRSNYCRTGYGMTEYEAKLNAIEEARRESGDQDGYSGDMNSATTHNSKCIKKPKIAKRCKVEKNVQKGTRKWITVYVVEPKWSSHCNAYEVVKTSQGDAMKRAKELALKHNEEMVVTIDKQLDNGNNKIASVRPNNSERGAWKFWGEARC